MLESGRPGRRGSRRCAWSYPATARRADAGGGRRRLRTELEGRRRASPARSAVVAPSRGAGADGVRGDAASVRPRVVARGRGGFGGSAVGGPDHERRKRGAARDQKVIEGVLVGRHAGTTIVIPAGAIGNQQPITVTSEQWFSPDLEILVMTRHSDPRSGETSYTPVEHRARRAGSRPLRRAGGLHDQGKRLHPAAASALIELISPSTRWPLILRPPRFFVPPAPPHPRASHQAPGTALSTRASCTQSRTRIHVSRAKLSSSRSRRSDCSWRSASSTSSSTRSSASCAWARRRTSSICCRSSIPADLAQVFSELADKDRHAAFSLLVERNSRLAMEALSELGPEAGARAPRRSVRRRDRQAARRSCRPTTPRRSSTTCPRSCRPPSSS